MNLNFFSDSILWDTQMNMPDKSTEWTWVLDRRPKAAFVERITILHVLFIRIGRRGGPPLSAWRCICRSTFASSLSNVLCELVLFSCDHMLVSLSYPQAPTNSNARAQESHNNRHTNPPRARLWLAWFLVHVRCNLVVISLSFASICHLSPEIGAP